MKFLKKYQFGVGITFFTFGVLVGALLIVCLQAGKLYDYKDTVDGAKVPEVDAIVCLAGGRGRIAAASDFWFRYYELEEQRKIEKTPLLYISGMGSSSNWNTFSKLVRAGVLASMRPSDVTLETESLNTEENAIWVAKNAQLRGWKKIVLMTSPYHMKRATHIFQKVLKKYNLPLPIETLSVYTEPFDPEDWYESFLGIRVTLWEYLKLIYYTTIWRA